jgi:hypothetical protein
MPSPRAPAARASTNRRGRSVARRLLTFGVGHYTGPKDGGTSKTLPDRAAQGRFRRVAPQQRDRAN